jgi:hypothetical protein
MDYREVEGDREFDTHLEREHDETTDLDFWPL